MTVDKKKAPDNPALICTIVCSGSAAGEEINDREKHNYRERTDHQHVTQYAQ